METSKARALRRPTISNIEKTSDAFFRYLAEEVLGLMWTYRTTSALQNGPVC
ncbi:MAG: hypothetical protein AB1898_27675 [Acidobacteriota bacterium]